MTIDRRSLVLGITVDINSEVAPNGRFARVHDPQGNPIELWEPAGLAR